MFIIYFSFLLIQIILSDVHKKLDLGIIVKRFWYGLAGILESKGKSIIDFAITTKLQEDYDLLIVKQLDEKSKLRPDLLCFSDQSLRTLNC